MMFTVWTIALVSTIIGLDYLKWIIFGQLDWPNVPAAIFWIFTAAISCGILYEGGWNEYVAAWIGG